jgi:hypothetical protein
MIRIEDLPTKGNLYYVGDYTGLVDYVDRVIAIQIIDRINQQYIESIVELEWKYASQF